MARVGRWVLLTCATGLVLLALAAWVTSGFRLSAGPIRISATDPSRILLEAATLWLLAALVPKATPSRPLVTLLPILALIVTSIIDSSPRRVGDGHEYVAMAFNMSRGGGPALLPQEIEDVTTRLREMPGFGDVTIEEPLVGSDGRQDFYHFWLYPLAVAPLAALTRLAGLHLNNAFTLVNLMLFVGLLYWLVRHQGFDAAAMIGAGPLLWWIDKAHSEVFIFVALASAALLIDKAPAIAVIAAAAAAAQNPAALIVFILCVGSLVLPGRRVSFATILAAIALAALAPMYYFWHLGTWSPLSSTIQRAVPGLRSLVTPLLDPNLGLLPYAPVLCAIACLGITRQSSRRLLVTLGGSLVLLVVFAQSVNVNHGGSPGMSRYALWLLALAVPLIAEGCARLARHRAAMYVACAASIVFSIAVFRPVWPDRAGDSPNWLAATLWTRVPALDNPVPEVFAERVLGRDGFATLPAATGLCEKVLIRGDGQDAWWPVPCTPQRAPSECVANGALCYVSDGIKGPPDGGPHNYHVAPRQIGFSFDPAPEHSWTSKTTQRFEWLLPRLGGGLRISRLSERGGRFSGGNEIEYLYLVEGSIGSAAWVRALPRPVEPPVLQLELLLPSRVEVLDGTLAAFRAPAVLPPGVHSIPLAAATPLLVLVTDDVAR